MKYHVAMIVSVLAVVVLIGGACVQTLNTEQKNSALRATLSSLSIPQLTRRFWECQPQSAGEPYKRDAAYCAQVNNVMERRAKEVPALQVVDISTPAWRKNFAIVEIPSSTGASLVPPPSSVALPTLISRN
jgi:hypothetical protein